jgi:aryl-alcohol dehydrogenase-like predicted oxidoreductase
MWKTHQGAPLVGMGCMRLSTDPARDEERAIAVLHAAFDEGINFLDTANVYCWNQDDIGHNERLIARALTTWCGDRSSIVVATKGGLVGIPTASPPCGGYRSFIISTSGSTRGSGNLKNSLTARR